MQNQKKSGIIMPVFSLPSEYGIGTLGESAYKFVDFLKLAKEDYWQVLPIEPTTYGDSPYQSPASFASNPYFIDLPLLELDGLITKNDYDDIIFTQNSLIDYAYLFHNKITILKKAYKNKELLNKEFKKYRKENEFWLSDYGLFMAIKETQNQRPFYEWPDELKYRDKKALFKFLENNKELAESYEFIQFLFYRQWMKLKDYANKQGIKIIGDLPIYVAHDSLDVWQNPKLFLLDKGLMPKFVAGCPPDDFAPLGQLWGNPLYDWPEHKRTNYHWWIDRVEIKSKYFDEIRIDHFRGFAAYYQIKAGSDNAVKGSWKKGPGIELFNFLKNELEDFPIIAEDLGFIDAKVRTLLKKTGFPGMKVLQFGLLDRKSEHNPENIKGNYFIYPGTHDNDTLVGWFNKLSYEEKKYINFTYGIDETKYPNYKIIKRAFACEAKAVVVLFQDYLMLDNKARINTPATKENNWRFRFKRDDFNNELARIINELKQ